MALLAFLAPVGQDLERVLLVPCEVELTAILDLLRASLVLQPTLLVEVAVGLLQTQFR